jgi:hypothetical protein
MPVADRCVRDDDDDDDGEVDDRDGDENFDFTAFRDGERCDVCDRALGSDDDSGVLRKAVVAPLRPTALTSSSSSSSSSSPSLDDAAPPSYRW